MQFRPTSVSITTAGTPAQTVRCPLCGAAIAPDTLGFVECICGWGGPGDPLEAARGLSRWITRLDRRWAGALVRRDLERMAVGKWRPGRLGLGYAVALLLASTVIYGIVAALLIGSVVLSVDYIRQQLWGGLVLTGILFAVTLMSVVVARPRAKGVTATRARFPRLFSALDEVSAQVRAPMPGRVVLLPTAEAYVFAQRPPRRLFRRELVLGLGVGALPLLSEGDLKAILAHELAHFGFGHTALHLYYVRAEVALRNFIEVLLEAVGTQTTYGRRVYFRRPVSRGFGATITQLGTFGVWIVTLPMRAVLVLFHLLRMAESRAAEFDVDRAAAISYGPQAFADGLTGLLVASRTMRGSFDSLRGEMAKHGERNFYAQMRRHYAELPPAIIAKLRVDAACEFRSLERTHPCPVDRLRAAYTVPSPSIAAPAEPSPAVSVIAPAGEADATSVELALTEMLFDMASQQDRRRGGRRRR